jgi:hypothetical protein
MKWQRKRQRSIDLEILWPVCKEQSVDLDRAKAAFAYHCFNDRSWTADFSEEELKNYINVLQ